MEFFVGAAGLWLLCGIGAAIVASSKGRSGCGWLILGFLLGPIGLIISAGMSNLDVAAKLDDAAIERQHEQASLWPCPMCAEMIQRAAIKCRFCGFEITTPPPPAPARERVNSGHYSAWWLVVIGAILVVVVKACAH